MGEHRRIKPVKLLEELRRTKALKNIFVGNLAFSTQEQELEELFGQHGEVHSVRLITDRETGRPRGFGFVEMDASGADAAIQQLDGVVLGGRNLRVNEATERKPRQDRRPW